MSILNRRFMNGEPPWEHIDPGVVDLVRLLWRAGFQPTDSGDGMSKPPAGRVFEFPHVVLSVTGSQLFGECDRIARVLARSGYYLHPQEGWHVEASTDWTADTGAVFVSCAGGGGLREAIAQGAAE